MGYVHQKIRGHECQEDVCHGFWFEQDIDVERCSCAPQKGIGRFQHVVPHPVDNFEVPARRIIRRHEIRIRIAKGRGEAPECPISRFRSRANASSIFSWEAQALFNPFNLLMTGTGLSAPSLYARVEKSCVCLVQQGKGAQASAPGSAMPSPQTLR